MKLKFIGFIFLFSYTISYSQYKEMLHKPYKEKIAAIDILYRNTIEKSVQDSLYISVYAQEMQQWALANNDKELALEAELLEAYTYWHIYGHIHTELVQKLIDIAQKGEHEGVLHVQERALQVIAKHYWSKKSYENAFEWLLQSAKVLHKMKPEDFPNMAEHLNFIGLAYYSFEDYTSALIYYEKSSQIKKTEFNALRVIAAQNTVGLCYQKLGNFELSKNYFLKVINDTSEYQSPVWKGIASGNLGYGYYLQGNYEEAIPLFFKDIENGLNIKDYGLAAGATIPLADIYLKQNKLSESKQKIDESLLYIQKSKSTDRLRFLYPVMSKWYAANNQLELSTLYLDSALIAINEYKDKYSSLKLLRANQKVEAKEQEIAIKNLKNESQLMLARRNFIITIIGLLLLGSVLTFWFRNKYLLKKQQIKELAMENMEKALLNAKSQLKNLTSKIRQDNSIIDELQKDKVSKNNQEFLSKLKAKNILTPKDWEQFQNLFNEGYPYFIPSLMATYPHLSQGEIRCLCLKKLQLTNNEIALVLGVSANTVRVTKHRIRKRLNLESQEDLVEFIKNFK